jgi:hypothetical protein
MARTHRESWVVPVIVFEWTVIVVGLIGAMVVVMLR